jgi:hypothetical protein
MASAMVGAMTTSDDSCEKHEILFMRGSQCPMCEQEEEHDRKVAILEERVRQLQTTLEKYEQTCIG